MIIGINKTTKMNTRFHPALSRDGLRRSDSPIIIFKIACTIAKYTDAKHERDFVVKSSYVDWLDGVCEMKGLSISNYVCH